MCGFFGVVGEYDRQKAVRALKSISHRGPDFSGIYEEDGLFLGHNRLYILDKSAIQPMRLEGAVLLFNGEIYNYKEFDAKSDTRAILKARKIYKDDFLSHLEGMFALALWEDGTLVLAKDRFGKKPLYYHHTGSQFLFASEIKAILTYLGGAAFNEKALSGYLSYGSLPNHQTFYKDIFKVQGGERVVFDGTLKKSGYILEKEPHSAADLEELLSQSVRSRLQGDFEAASLLSGGIDSSLISAMAKKEQGSLATYSIGYKEGRYSELPFAKEVAKHIKSDHNEVIYTKDDFFESLEYLLNHFDEPIGDSASLPLWFLIRKIKKDGFKVVLSGEGGDEIFLGYRQYFEMADLLKARELKYKNWLKNYFKAHFSPNKEWEWYKRVWSDEILFRSSCEVFTDLQKNLFLKANVKDGESLEFLDVGYPDREDFKFFTQVDLKVRLESLYLHKLDMVSMASSIEARTPILDEKILRAALSHPDRAKEPKYLLKQIAKKYLPPQIVKRKKRGFSYPHMEWLMQGGFDEKMVQIDKKAGFFKQNQLQFLIQNAKRNRFSRHFWLVLGFLLWFERRFL